MKALIAICISTILLVSSFVFDLIAVKDTGRNGCHERRFIYLWGIFMLILDLLLPEECRMYGIPLVLFPVASFLAAIPYLDKPEFHFRHCLAFAMFFMTLAILPSFWLEEKLSMAIRSNVTFLVLAIFLFFIQFFQDRHAHLSYLTLMLASGLVLGNALSTMNPYGMPVCAISVSLLWLFIATMVYKEIKGEPLDIPRFVDVVPIEKSNAKKSLLEDKHEGGALVTTNVIKDSGCISRATEKTYEILYSRVMKLMEEEQPYLDPKYKMEDLIRDVYSNKMYVSAMVNKHIGCNFRTFLNNFRIEHAKKLLLENPGIRMTEVAMRSGFNNTTSFNVTFKEREKKAPTDWIHDEQSLQCDTES